jgi:hypothetical protein
VRMGRCAISTVFLRMFWKTLYLIFRLAISIFSSTAGKSLLLYY